MEELNYPYVDCDHHPGRREPGYVICEHIEGPDDVAYLHMATRTETGVISCLQCHSRCEDDEFVLANFRVSCAACLRGIGLQV